MVENILNLLEHQCLTSESLQERLQISKVELEIHLENLKKQHLIYLNSKNKYAKVNLLDYLYFTQFRSFLLIN